MSVSLEWRLCLIQSLVLLSHVSALLLVNCLMEQKVLIHCRLVSPHRQQSFL